MAGGRPPIYHARVVNTFFKNNNIIPLSALFGEIPTPNSIIQQLRDKGLNIRIINRNHPDAYYELLTPADQISIDQHGVVKLRYCSCGKEGVFCRKLCKACYHKQYYAGNTDKYQKDIDQSRQNNKKWRDQRKALQEQAREIVKQVKPDRLTPIQLQHLPIHRVIKEINLMLSK